jgi:hypothetical protein
VVQKKRRPALPSEAGCIATGDEAEMKLLGAQGLGLLSSRHDRPSHRRMIVFSPLSKAS